MVRPPLFSESFATSATFMFFAEIQLAAAHFEFLAANPFQDKQDRGLRIELSANGGDSIRPIRLPRPVLGVAAVGRDIGIKRPVVFLSEVFSQTLCL